MPATTAHQSSGYVVRATEVVAALAFQYGLAHLLTRAVSAATRRETADLGGHRIPAPGASCRGRRVAAPAGGG